MSMLRELASTLCTAHPEDAARLVEGLERTSAAALLADLPARAAAALVARLVARRAATLLADLAPGAAGAVVCEMAVDDAVRVLRLVDAGDRPRLLAATPPRLGAALAALLRHPERTAGALMDPLALAVPEDWTAGEALARVRGESEAVRHYLYVVDRDGGRLSGVLSLRMLLLAAPDLTLGGFMVREIEKVAVGAAVGSFIAHPAWRRFPVLPVVDESGAFVGTIRYETVHRFTAALEHEAAGQGTLATVVSLGELWWIGLGGLLAGLASPVTPADRERRHGR